MVALKGTLQLQIVDSIQVYKQELSLRMEIENYCIIVFMIKPAIVLLVIVAASCTSASNKKQPFVKPDLVVSNDLETTTHTDTSATTIHVFVALCDNQYQRIVPVPAAIGNGQDPDNNLYWGCGYGLRTFFKASKQWQLLKQYPVDNTVLERLIFKNKKHNAYLIADAYDGRYIQQSTTDFLKSCAGIKKDYLSVNKDSVGLYGQAKLLAYVGHDGLMDFQLTDTFYHADQVKRKAIMLACYSRAFFWQHLWYTQADPLIWTTTPMCPEAYTLHDALESYLNQEPTDSIRNKAAIAYAKYQKCSVKAAKGLLVSGWK